ncbi:MAG: shikimate kinase [Bacillota bacterium]|nr:shikimate kinase [Bacillota bacterium]MDW7683196.1 shikimate kinase [Bacillota bacterium]
MKRISGKNLILIGFMGTGKTEVGRLLAESLGRRLVDTDRLIVEREGKPVREIFQDRGEAYFRQVEKKIIGELSGQSGLVVSSGGGVVLDADNVARLRESGYVVWLDAAITDLEARLAGDTTRPLLAGNTDLAKLYGERRPFYRNAAHVRVDTTGKPPLAVAAEIIERIRGGT